MSRPRLPRLLAVMGSGETSPTMASTHRQLLARLGPPPVPAVLLDTPFGFQGNADDITHRARGYFRESVGQAVEAASYRSAAEVGSVGHEATLDRLREARYVFAGPGSPTYALRQWRASRVPSILADKLAGGGCLTFASAAALTLGVAVVPVYEIYKVGADAGWAEGLDLLALAGLRAAVIPHYDNTEGGTHDTRYCYLGEARLAAMERDLPEGAFVLGVDEHTGLVLDLDAGTATVVGRGGVTVRSQGRSTVLASGTETTIGILAELAAAAPAGAAEAGAEAGAGARAGALGGRRAGGPVPPEAGGGAAPAGAPAGVPAGASPLLEAVAARESAFARALGDWDVAAAVQALLDLEADLHAWSADTLDSDHLERGRALLRGQVVRLGELAATGARDPAEAVGPFVDALLRLRRLARDAGRYDDADAVRNALVELGVEVRDSPAGTRWHLRAGPAPGG